MQALQSLCCEAGSQALADPDRRARWGQGFLMLPFRLFWPNRYPLVTIFRIFHLARCAPLSGNAALTAAAHHAVPVHACCVHVRRAC